MPASAALCADAAVFNWSAIDTMSTGPAAWIFADDRRDVAGEAVRFRLLGSASNLTRFAYVIGIAQVRACCFFAARAAFVRSEISRRPFLARAEVKADFVV